MEPDSRFVPFQLHVSLRVGKWADGEEAFLSIGRIIMKIHWTVSEDADSGEELKGPNLRNEFKCDGFRDWIWLSNFEQIPCNHHVQIPVKAQGSS